MAPTDVVPAPVTLRPLARGDFELVRGWLKLPAVQRWWGNASSAEAEVRLVIETPSALPRLVLAGDEPIGYAHAIDALHWGSGLPDGMPPGTYDLDVFIAREDWRGRGAGREAVEQLAEEVFATTLAPAVSVITSLRNEGAIRAYEKAGFRWVRVYDDPIQGPSWLMLRDRPRAG